MCAYECLCTPVCVCLCVQVGVVGFCACVSLFLCLFLSLSLYIFFSFLFPPSHSFSFSLFSLSLSLPTSLSHPLSSPFLSVSHTLFPTLYICKHTERQRRERKSGIIIYTNSCTWAGNLLSHAAPSIQHLGYDNVKADFSDKSNNQTIKQLTQPNLHTYLPTFKINHQPFLLILDIATVFIR